MSEVEVLVVLRYLIGALKRAREQQLKNTSKFLKAELDDFMDKLENVYDQSL